MSNREKNRPILVLSTGDGQMDILARFEKAVPESAPRPERSQDEGFPELVDKPACINPDAFTGIMASNHAPEHTTRDHIRFMSGLYSVKA